MKNKTATECWNILRGELDSAIDSYVPMKKQGKRLKKKHLSKEAFRRLDINKICGGFVTPEVVASKINNMKENKSPGVDGISPKILKKTVEQISTSLAHVFNMSLQEEIVPVEWKEANIISLLKKGSRNKSVNYRSVSLTSVICKLLETNNRDHMMDFLVKN